MACYYELPDDFRNHWLQNMIYELFHYGKLTKVFEKRGYYIHIYEYITQRGKYTKLYTLKYNTMISSYEINTTRYTDYKQVLHVMWNLEKMAPL
jgi:hypothetical protein